MFEWAHMLHRQLYDIFAVPGLTGPERDRRVERALRYYRSRPDLALSTRPKNRIRRRLLANEAADALRGDLATRVPVLGRRNRTIARRNEALVASARAVAGKPVFADASKDVSRARLLDRTTDLAPCVIHLVRDSLGFVASKKLRAEKIAALPAGRGSPTPRGTGTGALPEPNGYLQRCPPSGDFGCATTLCTDPEREFGRICEMLGLEASGPYEFLAGDHHIIGNRMRLSSSSEIILDERWRSILTAEEAETVRRSTRRHRQTFRATPEVAPGDSMLEIAAGDTDRLPKPECDQPSGMRLSEVPQQRRESHHNDLFEVGARASGSQC